MATENATYFDVRLLFVITCYVLEILGHCMMTHRKREAAEQGNEFLSTIGKLGDFTNSDSLVIFVFYSRT